MCSMDASVSPGALTTRRKEKRPTLLSADVTQDGGTAVLPERGKKAEQARPLPPVFHQSMMSVGRRFLDIGKGADHRNDADEEEKEVHDALLC